MNKDDIIILLEDYLTDETSRDAQFFNAGIEVAIDLILGREPERFDPAPIFDTDDRWQTL